MAPSVKAIIKPEILVWARKAAGYKNLGAAAAKIAVTPEKLASWESGLDAPTVIQLRKIAGVYKRPIAIFYLPEAPKGVDVLHDFRTIPGGRAGEYSPELTFEIRKAYHRREKALEMYADLGETPIPVSLTASINDEVDVLAERIRQYLGVSKTVQEEWKTSYDALNGWKSAIESREILVFQASRIDVSEMRGFSIASQPSPVVVLNSADAPYARVFTLLHEMVHIALSVDGVCTLDSKRDGTEIFCNAVAGATLLPVSWFKELPAQWTDSNVRAVAKRFGMSNQVVIRRLLTLGKISQSEYNLRKAVYEKEAKEFAALQADKNTPITQSTKALSSAGKLFTKLVLDSYHQQKVTSSDVSDLLSVRLQYLKDIEAKVYGV
jgi:Zn-dependent peptidase ImmA (M78 family)